MLIFTFYAQHWTETTKDHLKKLVSYQEMDSSMDFGPKNATFLINVLFFQKNAIFSKSRLGIFLGIEKC